MPIRRMRRVRQLPPTQPPPFTDKQLRDFEKEFGKLVQKLLKEKALTENEE
jgi:hypothetical protein